MSRCFGSSILSRKGIKVLLCDAHIRVITVTARMVWSGVHGRDAWVSKRVLRVWSPLKWVRACWDKLMGG